MKLEKQDIEYWERRIRTRIHRDIATHGAPGTVEIDDLVQEGLAALVEASNNFDPSRSPNFAPYAWQKILGRLDDYRVKHSHPFGMARNLKRAARYVLRMQRLLWTSTEARDHASDVIAVWEHPIEACLSWDVHRDLRAQKQLVANAANAPKSPERYAALASEALALLSAHFISIDHTGFDQIDPSTLEPDADLVAERRGRELAKQTGDREVVALALRAAGCTHREIAYALHGAGLTDRHLTPQGAGVMVRRALKNAHPEKLG